MIYSWIIHKFIVSLKITSFSGLFLDDFDRKSEYVIYKLKEMGKISEQDISKICKQFERLDAGNCGKISLSDLIESRQ